MSSLSTNNQTLTTASSPCQNATTPTEKTETDKFKVSNDSNDVQGPNEFKRSPSPAKRRASTMENDVSHDARTQTTDETNIDELPSTQQNPDGMTYDDHNLRSQSVDMLRSPSPEESSSQSLLLGRDSQIKQVFDSIQRPLEQGQKLFIIDGLFLKKFYATASDHVPTKEDEQLKGELGQIDNSRLVDHTESLTGQEPLFIVLKRDLTISEDFDAVPEDTWTSLVQTFGLATDSPTIVRHVVNTVDDSDTGSKNLQIDLYPPLFTVNILKGSQPLSFEAIKQSAQPLKPLKFVASKAELFQHFLLNLKNTLGVSTKSKVRLWKLSKLDSPLPDTLSLDISTFLEIEYGNRELVELEDKTAALVNGKFNGTQFNIAQAGFSEGGRIIVEVQDDNEWPSDRVGKALKKNVGSSAVPVSISKGNVTSTSLASAKTAARNVPVVSNGVKSTSTTTTTSSSPSRTIATRSNAKPLGTCGLNNLGNTCYMNSALQCVRSVEELSKYFLAREYEKELNPGNPLAHGGRVAKGYATLLSNLFAPNNSTFAPREFKNMIGRYAPSFSGFGQQDSQEFLAFVLDGLHEDLNRIQKKPYIEKPESTDEMVGNQEAITALAKKCWDIYKARNDSAVADLFGGQYKSTLICPVCEKVSITFDPFMDLTLPLPLENMWSKDITFIPFREGATDFKHAITINIEMDKHSSLRSLKEFIAVRMNVDPKKLVCSEVYKNRFYKHHDDFDSVGESIQANDDIFVYELEKVPTNHPPPKGAKKTVSRGILSNLYNDPDDEQVSLNESAKEKMLVPIFHKLSKEPQSRYSSSDFFGVPFFIVLDKEEQRDFDAIVEKIVEQYQLFTTRNLFDTENIQGDSQQDDVSEIELEEAEDEQEYENTIKIDDEDKEGSEGFVDVSMEDAANHTSEVNGRKTSTRSKTPSNKKRVPIALLQAWKEMFELKVLPRKDDKLPTAWSSTESQIPLLRSRVPRPGTPSATAQAQAKPTKRRAVNRAPTPSSETSDEDLEGSFQDAETGDTNNSMELMNDASDDDEIKPDQGMIPRPSRFQSVKNSILFGRGAKNTGETTKSTQSYEDSLLKLGEGIICYWSEEAYDSVFCGREEDGLRGMAMFEAKETFIDEELTKKRQLRESRRRKGIHLEDCLDEFSKEEILSEDDPWYCPRCKEHRRASKTFELWKCPDIVVIHLKRFSSSRSFRDKIDALIDFPIEGLDLTDRVGEKEDGRGLIYDLFAVDNHYGGLGGGHYTAYARNWEDGNWYSYDDSSVRQTQPKSVITPAAYLLFYRRRSSKPLGGPNYERILTQIAEEASQNGSSSPSPSSSDSSPRSSSQSSGDGLRGGTGGSTLPLKSQDPTGLRSASTTNLSTASTFNDSSDLPLYSFQEADDNETFYGQQPLSNLPLSAPPQHTSSILFGPSFIAKPSSVNRTGFSSLNSSMINSGTTGSSSHSNSFKQITCDVLGTNFDEEDEEMESLNGLTNNAVHDIRTTPSSDYDDDDDDDEDVAYMFDPPKHLNDQEDQARTLFGS